MAYEKVSDIIKDALIEITVLGAEAPVEAAEAQSAIRYMNRMMSAFVADGIDLGYTQVSNLSDDVTVSAGAYEGIVANLAMRLWGQFSDGKPPPADLIAKARGGLDTLRVMAFSIGESAYPSTLPYGSGTEEFGASNDHFFPDLQDDILTS